MDMALSNAQLKKPSGWVEVSEHEFRRAFFTFKFEKEEPRQIYYVENNIKEGLFNSKLFELDYSFADGLGFAIVDDWKSDKLRFFKYGSRIKWREFENKYSNTNK
jgi:hypothetical protein